MGFFLEIFRLGLRNLRLHKLRSTLTSLGIILGVAAVIVVVAGLGTDHVLHREAHIVDVAITRHLNRLKDFHQRLTVIPG